MKIVIAKETAQNVCTYMMSQQWRHNFFFLSAFDAHTQEVRAHADAIVIITCEFSAAT